MKKVMMVIATVMLMVSVKTINGQIIPGDPALFKMPTINSTASASYYNNFEDGNYYAYVKYYNPATYTNSTYKLVVTVSNDKVTKIHFSDGYLHDGYNSSGYTWSGGHLNSNGSTSVTIYTSNLNTRTYSIELQ
jgi:hypothetical protein